MKRLFLTTVVVGLVAVIMSGCGGSGSGSKTNKLKSNEYLGKLPAIYTDYDLAVKEYDEKMAELRGKVQKYDAQKMENERQKIRQKRREMEEKSTADAQAEWEKVTGRDVPFTSSEEFKKLNYEVTSVKLRKKAREFDINGISASVIAKNDFKIRYYDEIISAIYYKAIAKDGSIINKHYLPLTIGIKSYTKGELLTPKEGFPALLQVQSKPEMWADFAGIEFITKEEYNNIK